MTEPTKRKLIEVALPLEAINVASAREKSIRRGHPSTLHLWWARRPLAACRAVLFASLVDDPSSDPERFPTPRSVEEERTRLFGIIERLVLWESTKDEAVLEEARLEIRRSTGGKPPPVLDPFCGGGSIPLEAQRLGLTAFASDLNPVAVLVTKALVEIPPKFAGRPPVHPGARGGVGATGEWKGAAGLAEDVRRYGTWMREEAERRIGDLYPRVMLPQGYGAADATVIAWLWARTVTCPNPACRTQMPLASSFALSTKVGQQAWVEPIIDRAAKTVSFRVRTGVVDAAEWTRTLRGTSLTDGRGAKIQATFACAVCQVGIARGEYIDAEANAGRMSAVLLAVVADLGRRRVYVSPSADQLTPVGAATDVIQTTMAAKLPIENARGTFASNAQGRMYGFHQFKDYFSARQLVALATFSDLVSEARAMVIRDALSAGLAADSGSGGATDYGDALATYLACAVDKGANLWSSITSWMSDRGAFRETFARQGIPMVWDYAEANPFSQVGGNFGLFVERVADAVEFAPAGPQGEVAQANATSVTTSEPAVVCTDPPYYNNIGYSDLSDYFYVWLRRSLAAIYPGLFATVLTPKTDELIATPYRFGGDQSAANAHFETGLGEAFTRARDISPSEFPITFFYAFKQSESGNDSYDGSTRASTGWDTMLTGLIRSGFAIEATWPMRTEGSGRLVSVGTNSLASSVLLVCRPRSAGAGITTRRDFLAALRRELPAALRTLQHGNIAPVDLTQASIGPGMSMFSRYAKVLEPDGSTMSVGSALGQINKALDEILREQEGEFDAETRWAIRWYELYGLRDGPSGIADDLARARVTSLGGLVSSGIVASGRGKTRLLPRDEYSRTWDPARDSRVPVWEATQRLVHALLSEGEGAAEDLISRIGGVAEVARDLAYVLHKIADDEKWPDEARAYNALVVAWPELVRGASNSQGDPVQVSLGLDEREGG
ncbi:MAG: DUF1156 domain-containing protein [Erythrobacter sp.]|nr:DUF1156 domain-containing protein [Erythrobacter sp.]